MTQMQAVTPEVAAAKIGAAVAALIEARALVDLGALRADVDRTLAGLCALQLRPGAVPDPALAVAFTPDLPLASAPRLPEAARMPATDGQELHLGVIATDDFCEHIQFELPPGAGKDEQSAAFVAKLRKLGLARYFGRGIDGAVEEYEGFLRMGEQELRTHFTTSAYASQMDRDIAFLKSLGQVGRVLCVRVSSETTTCYEAVLRVIESRRPVSVKFFVLKGATQKTIDLAMLSALRKKPQFTRVYNSLLALADDSRERRIDELGTSASLVPLVRAVTDSTRLYNTILIPALRESGALQCEEAAFEKGDLVAA